MNNELHTIPEELCNLQHLTWLNLDGNLMHKLPSNIANLCELVYLSLNFNHFEEVPIILKDMHSLVSLQMRRNRITMLPDDTVTALSFLNRLDIRENGIVSRPQSWKVSSEIHFSKTKIVFKAFFTI